MIAGPVGETGRARAGQDREKIGGCCIRCLGIAGRRVSRCCVGRCAAIASGRPIDDGVRGGGVFDGRGGDVVVAAAGPGERRPQSEGERCEEESDFFS